LDFWFQISGFPHRLCYNTAAMPVIEYAPPQPPRGALYVVLFIVFIDLMGFGIILPQLPFFGTKYHASHLQVVLIFSIFSACQFVAAPILGLISDRLGRRPVLIFSQLGSAAGYVLLGYVTQANFESVKVALGLIYLARFIDGISGGNVSTAQAYISDVTTPQTRARGMGLLGAAFGVGFSAGPAITWAVGNDTTRVAWPAYTAAIFSLIAAVLSWARLPESRAKGPVSEEAWLHPSRFLPILRQRVLAQLLVTTFVAMTAFTMLEATIGLFLSEKFTQAKNGRPWGQQQVGLYFVYLGVFLVVVQGGAMGRLVKRWGEWSVSITGGVLVVCAMALYVVVGMHPAVWILLLAGAFNATGRSMHQPPISSLLSKLSDRSQQGTVFGMYHGLGSLARAIGPLLGGLFLAHVFNAGQYVVAGVMMLGVSAWLIYLRRMSPKTNPPISLAPATDRSAVEAAVEPA
jgi:DHA1 family tetracycline resistance protein-like MFS transporter